MSELPKDEKENNSTDNIELLNRKTYRNDPERQAVRQKHLDE
jgi:hypothetical protein